MIAFNVILEMKVRSLKKRKQFSDTSAQFSRFSHFYFQNALIVYETLAISSSITYVKNNPNNQKKCIIDFSVQGGRHRYMERKD